MTREDRVRRAVGRLNSAGADAAGTGAYTVLYTVTIAMELEASRPASALDLAMSDAAVDGLMEMEWDRQDITRVEIIGIGQEHIPPGDSRRLAVER